MESNQSQVNIVPIQSIKVPMESNHVSWDDFKIHSEHHSQLYCYDKRFTVSFDRMNEIVETMSSKARQIVMTRKTNKGEQNAKDLIIKGANLSWYEMILLSQPVNHSQTREYGDSSAAIDILCDYAFQFVRKAEKKTRKTKVKANKDVSK